MENDFFWFLDEALWSVAMLRPRVIPCLLMLDGGLVKTRRFSDPKYVGDPINVIKIFNTKEVDELMVLDIGATRKGAEPRYDLIEECAGECFMPLCYGGGIKRLDQAIRIFSLGIEKICVQSSALQNLDLVSQVASRFGSQAVVVSVDVKKDWLGRRKLYSAAERKVNSTDWLEFAKRAVDAGAGEILLNSVDRDGTLSGMDCDLIREATQMLQVPVIAVGGAGSLHDLRSAIRAGAGGVAAGAFFVFQGPHRAVLVTYPHPEEIDRLSGDESD